MQVLTVFDWLRGHFMIILSVAASIFVALLAFAAALWWQVHWLDLKNWLLAPFRSWTGLDDSRRPKL